MARPFSAGQWWKLFNLDKRESVNCGGANIGEFFSYNRNESFMVNLLLTGQPNHAAWGGDRIVLLGYFAESLPPNTVTDEDSAVLKTFTAASSPEKNRPSDAIWNRYRELQRAVGRGGATSLLPRDTVYILRSLNKKEYIRRDTVRDYRKYDKGRIPGLAQALYTVVGWSDGWGTELEYSVKNYVPASGGTTIPLHRGAWAGNRIDVVALTDEMQTTLDEEGWTDISEETARHVSDVCACADSESDLEH